MPWINAVIIFGAIAGMALFGLAESAFRRWRNHRRFVRRVRRHT